MTRVHSLGLKRVSAIGLLLLGACAALLVVRPPSAADAQSGVGTVNGRVLWGSCVRIALPAGASEVAPDVVEVQPVPAQPDAPMPNIIRQPTPTRALPAGAVLVAIQNTGVNARTDEAGRFSLSSVPAGHYLTVAAGPVANNTTAMAMRPNVFVDGGQTVDLGTLVLGGTSPNLACRPIIPGAAESTPDEAP